MSMKQGSGMVMIRAAQSAQDYALMEQLIHQFVAFLRQRYRHDDWFVTEVLDKQSLDSELQVLAAIYGPPTGRAFIAVDQRPEGELALACGAFKKIGDGVCEMKRVFVSEAGRGTGIGRQLVTRLIEAARDEGYGLMKLDTGALLAEAISLYQSLGFTECAPYNDYPEKLQSYLRFMSLPLGKV